MGGHGLDFSVVHTMCVYLLCAPGDPAATIGVGRLRAGLSGECTHSLAQNHEPALSSLQGHIKGYISHQHQKLVVSKQNPFPPLSTVC